MPRFKKQLVAGIEEQDRQQEQEKSLKEQFEKKEKKTVYVESLPEKVFRITLNVFSYALSIVGIISLLLPQTRVTICAVLLRFIGEVTGAIRI